MIDHKGSTEEIEAAISRAETLLEDWLWAAAHVQHYDHLIKQVENVPTPEGPISIPEWVAHQQKLDAARKMSAALSGLKEPHRQSELRAYWGLAELLPRDQVFVICAFGLRYYVEVMRNYIIVKRMEV